MVQMAPIFLTKISHIAVRESGARKRKKKIEAMYGNIAQAVEQNEGMSMEKL